MLVALDSGEPLLLYIALTMEVVSMVLIVERDEPRTSPNGSSTTGLES
jgi:hypothetical protein